MTLNENNSNTPKRAAGSKLKLLVKLAISGGLLYLIFRNVKVDALLQSARLISLETLVLVSFLYLVSQLLSALKWRILIQGVGIARGLGHVIRAYVFGMFVNVFGLGTVGGDVARAVALKPERGERAAIFATVLADRVQGLAVLLAVGCFTTGILRPSHFPDYVIYTAYLMLIGIVGFWFAGPFLLLHFFGKLPKINNIATQIGRAFPSQTEPLVTTTLISFMCHALQIFAFFVIAQELEAPVTLAYLFAVIPMVNTLATLPVSISGIGVRESVLILLLAPTGVQEEACVAMGAVWLFTSSLVSALGGVILAPDLLRSGEKLLDQAPPEGAILDLDSARENRRSSRR